MPSIGDVDTPKPEVRIRPPQTVPAFREGPSGSEDEKSDPATESARYKIVIDLQGESNDSPTTVEPEQITTGSPKSPLWRFHEVTVKVPDILNGSKLSPTLRRSPRAAAYQDLGNLSNIDRDPLRSVDQRSKIHAPPSG